MRTRIISWCCLLGILTCGISSIPSDAQARRFNPEDVKKQLEASGVNTEDGQTREQRLEALRDQAGIPEGSTGVSSRTGVSSQKAADVEIPANTKIMVQLDKALDSSEMGEGEQFTGRLEADLVVDNTLLAARGSTVYGNIVTSTRARNVAGTSVLEFMLIGMDVDNQMRPIESNHIKVESKKSGRLQAAARVETDETLEFNIGEEGSNVESHGTETISGPDKKATDRVDERRNSRRHRRD